MNCYKFFKYEKICFKQLKLLISFVIKFMHNFDKIFIYIVLENMLIENDLIKSLKF